MIDMNAMKKSLRLTMMFFVNGVRVGTAASPQRGKGVFPMMRTKLIPLLAAAFALLAVATCEWLAEPEPEIFRPAAGGVATQALAEELGEDPHMVALAQAIPGFGGYWYEPGGGPLVIALTEVGAGSFPAARRAVLAMLAAEVTNLPSVATEPPEPPPTVVERAVEYSFIELARHRARLRALFAVPEVVSLGVDEKGNRVEIGLEDPSAKAAVLDIVGDLAVPVEVLSFSQESRVKMLGKASGASGKLAPHLSASGSADWLKGPSADGKLRAGYQVEAEGGKTCTLGFTGVLDNGGVFFVSNSHCSKIPWKTDLGDWGQPDTASENLVGVEASDPQPRRCWKRWKGLVPIRVDCRHSDASMMAVSTDDTIALGEIGRTKTRHRKCTLGLPDPFIELCDIFIDATDPTIRIVDIETRSHKGDVLDKVGSATGWTWGKVKKTCKDVRGETGVVIECADIVDFWTAWGDSGGPVFKYLNNGTAQFRGIVFGMLNERSGGGGVHREGVFQDLNGIKNDLGEAMTLIDPGSPAVEIVGPHRVPPGKVCTWTARTRGLKPLGYKWSGVLGGSGESVTDVVKESGWLRVKVTDPLERTARDSIEVTVARSRSCKRRGGGGGGDTIRPESGYRGAS